MAESHYRCRLCGSHVTVHTSGEGTCSYESVAEQAIRDALAWLDGFATAAGPMRRPHKQLVEILRRGLGEEP